MSKNFQQAQNAFQNQQQRQQQVSQLLTGIGQTTGQEAQRLGQGIGAFGEAQQQLAGAGQALTQSQTQLLAGLGNLRQQQAQTELDAARQSQLQQIYEPFQRIGFTSDIFKPNIGSAASTIGTQVAPSPSPLSQAIGAGTAVLGGIKAFGNPFESIFKPSST
jgi:ABC-type transporter Mla subunit MlaD